MTPLATTADVVAAVATLERRTRDRAAFVGIDGRGAAGKTSLAAALAGAVERVVVVHVDDFSAPRFSTWDYDRFETQLAAPLRAGRPARYQRWDWDSDSGAEWHTVEPGAVVVVEGVSSTRKEVELPWDLRIWVDAPRPVRLARARERDGAAMMSRWLEDWMPSEEAYIAAQHPERRVDLVVDGTDATFPTKFP